MAQPHHSNTDDEARLNRIEEIANDCLVRRAAGEVISDDSIIAAHPDLMPELGEWFHCMKVISDVVQLDARGDSVAVPNSFHRRDEEFSGQGFGSIHTRCPQCHHQIELASDAEFSDVNCPSCGSNFNLLGHDKFGDADEGSMVADFRLLDRIGFGAFGTVWRALDTKLDRTVALKLPRKGQLDSMETEQFLREARSAAQLKHPNIVSIHEVGREDRQVYIVSDFINGRTLADLLVEKPTTAREATAEPSKTPDSTKLGSVWRIRVKFSSWKGVTRMALTSL